MDFKPVVTISWELLFQIINTVILFLVLKKLLFKPVLNIIEKRENMIQDDLATGAKAKNEGIALKKEYEEKILGAEEKILSLESKLFNDLVLALNDYIPAIQHNANLIARLDCLLSFAITAKENHYIRPNINDGDEIDIKEGRHPVIEKQLPPGEEYISNSISLSNDNQQIIMITGPNMAGKSALLRQTALIVILAQIGSFVPAESAKIGLVDKVFTRVGASDNISLGESTFMVEMNEAADILNNISNRSLVLFDELGRGTSTYDGISIAWAIVEHIHEHPKARAKTLFATHYHELTELEGKIPGVNNYCIAVKEKGDDIVFLRKIVQGGADKSYGIQVAKLAGVPDSVIQRAKELVEELSDADITAAVKDLTSAKKKKPVYDQMDMAQMSLFDTVKDNDIIDEIKDLDMGNMTPIEAMNTLYNLQNKIKNRW